MSRIYHSSIFESQSRFTPAPKHFLVVLPGSRQKPLSSDALARPFPLTFPNDTARSAPWDSGLPLLAGITLLQEPQKPQTRDPRASSLLPTSIILCNPHIALDMPSKGDCLAHSSGVLTANLSLKQKDNLADTVRLFFLFVCFFPKGGKQ